jgi:xanthine dehydrogenase YagS FAD-binding subunit
LKGKILNDGSKRVAADAAFAGAQTHEHNAFKIELGKQTLVCALDQAAAMEI